MNTKTKVVTKTVGSSWISSIVLALIMGIIGLVISPTLEGFTVGFAMTFVMGLIMLVSIIPIVGVYFQWQFSIAFTQWLVAYAFPITSSQYGVFTNVLIYIPLIIFTIFGVVLCAVTSVLAIVAIGAIIGAILS